MLSAKAGATPGGQGWRNSALPGRSPAAEQSRRARAPCALLTPTAAALVSPGVRKKKAADTNSSVNTERL
jgi:hypothetical protein